MNANDPHPPPSGPVDPYTRGTASSAPPETTAHGAAQTWQTAKETAQSVADGAAQAWEATRHKAGEAVESGERYVREHTCTSLLSVFGIGMLLGGWIVWSCSHEERNDTADTLNDLLKRLGRKLNLG